MKQYSRRECIEIAGMLWVIPHVIPKDVVIKLLTKIEMNFFKKMILRLVTDLHNPTRLS